MATRKLKKLGLMGSGAMVAVMVIASSAFACTSISGTVTLEGLNGTTVNGTSNGSITYNGNGGDFGSGINDDGYCGGLPSSRIAMNTVNTSLPGAPDFRLTVAPYDCGAGQVGSKTIIPATETDRAGTWEVRLVRAQTAIDTSPSRPICHLDADHNDTLTNPTSRWASVGTMPVNVNGEGTNTYVLPSTMVGPVNLCIDKHSVLESTFPLLDGSGGIVPPILFLNLI